MVPVGILPASGEAKVAPDRGGSEEDDQNTPAS